MVNLRRFGPLIAALAIAVAVLLSRLYDVQVREHDVWAREAANLVRSWSVEPYRRGRIVDRRGREIVRDEEGYELEFVWRDFRRGHPLGQIAQLRSLVVMRTVSLQESRERLLEWAQDFVRLSPREVDEFGRGESILVGTERVPRVAGESSGTRRENTKLDRRASRAADLHFYVKSLLDPEREHWRQIEKARRTRAAERSYVEIVAGISKLPALDLWAQVETRLLASLEELGRLAELLDWSVRDDDPEWGTPAWGSSLDRLIYQIERKREDVQFAIADDLFRRATGFDPARLDAINLASIDLDWLRRALVWDDARLAQWRVARGDAWPEAVEAFLAGHAIARAKLGADHSSAADRVLSSLAYFFHDASRPRTRPGTAEPRHWSEVDALVVLGDFHKRFKRARSVPDELRGPLLPIENPALRASPPRDGEALLRAGLGPVAFPARAEGSESSDEIANEWQELLAVAATDRRSWDERDTDVFGAALLAWDALVQQRVDRLFKALPGAPELVTEWVATALKNRDYTVRDRGARPLTLEERPRYELVYQVTRYPERYSGFQVRTTTRRFAVALHDPNAEFPQLAARPLIGLVRTPYLVSLLEQRPIEVELNELRTQRVLPKEARARIVGAVSSTWQVGQLMGGSGLEGYFDRELTGRNGYRQSTGLSDRTGSGREPIFQPPVDGAELVLTLDLDLQRAAQNVIDNPDPPPAHEDKPDRVWHAFPVGAIVLATVDGDLLAAASGPSRAADPGPFQDNQREHSGDRTLRQHSFQPPGSVFKPFVAAQALDRGWIEADGFSSSCSVRDDKRLGMHRDGAQVHCHASSHGDDVRLHYALTQSCNAYFANLGESFFKGPAFNELVDTFGFNEPTGVRLYSDRPGLAEDWRSMGYFERPAVPSPLVLQRLANGLVDISATPMQVARAYIGLATGILPEMRLVDRIGGEQAPRRFEVLDLSTKALETVRRALREVPLTGTAHGDGLDPESLGFTFACKTGSADFYPGRVPKDPQAPMSGAPEAWEKGMRKHGWVAGWFPAENPVAIAVVYVHNTSTTSSHVATHVMRQFLSTDAVKAWLEEAR